MNAIQGCAPQPVRFHSHITGEAKHSVHLILINVAVFAFFTNPLFFPNLQSTPIFGVE